KPAIIFNWRLKDNMHWHMKSFRTRPILSHARTTRHSHSDTAPNGPTDTGTPGTSRSMNARSVPTARYAPHAQRQPTVGTERFTTMKNGKHKKHISERSFRKKKPVGFTANVKSMSSPSSDF